MPGERQWRALAASLRPLMVKLYAESREWEVVPLADARYWLLRHSSKRLRQLQIPMDTEDPGYEDAMFEVLRRLSELETRPLEAVLGDLQSANADVLRVRVSGRGTEAGLFSFSADVELREGTRRALLASACSVVNPARFHPRLSRTEADTLLAACQAGQTERGSYVLKVICPLHAVDQSDAEEPFTRQVTRYLMQTTHRLVSNIENDTFDEYKREPDETQPWLGPPLSSNLCDALLRMQSERDDAQIELSTSWAADRRVRPPEGVPTRVAVKPEYFKEIEQIAKVLRPVDNARSDEVLVATVEQLAGEVDADGRRSGEVTFNILKDDEKLRARARLDADQYLVALEAHEKGNAYVVLHGRLRRGARVSRLEALRTITPLAE